VGTLMRVLRRGEAPPPADVLERMNRDTFSGYQLEPRPPVDEHGWGYDLQGDYARAWGEIGTAYARVGDLDKETECFEQAALLAPWMVIAH
jgi:hypothetical protein